MPKVISNDQLSSVSMGLSGETYHWRDWDIEPNFIEAPGDGGSTPGLTPLPGTDLLPGASPQVWDAYPQIPGGGFDVLPTIGITPEWAEQASLNAGTSTY